jgi:hypothetical protein
LHFADADLLIDARTVLLDGRRSSHGTTNGFALLCCYTVPAKTGC